MAQTGSSGIALGVTWPVMKQLIVDKGLSLHYEEVEPSGSFDSLGRYRIFAIDGGVFYETNIWTGNTPPSVDQTQNDIDKAEFEAGFQNTANTENANVVAISVTAPPVEVTVSTAAAAVRWEKLTEDQTFGTGGYTTIYSKAGPVKLLSSVLQFNSNRVLLQVDVDSTNVMDEDLEEIDEDFRLRGGLFGGSSGGGAGSPYHFSIYSYANKRFSIRPKHPLRALTNLTIKCKSKGGNKRLERGRVEIDVS